MKFHGINCTGKFILQKVTALPIWTPADEGRMIYDEIKTKLYIGTDTEWVEAGGGGGYGTPITNFIDNGELEDGKLYLINTSTGRLTGNLPDTPDVGDTITIIDVASTFNTYPFTINGNTNNIHNDPILETDVKDVVLILVYTGTNWKLDVGGIVTGNLNNTMEVLEFNESFNATTGLHAFVDTRDDIVTVTLPIETDLSLGTTVTIYDEFLSFRTNKCRVVTTTAQFENGTTMVELTNNGSKTAFIWNSGTHKWRMEQIGFGTSIGNIINITDDYDADVSDFIFADTLTGGPITITLPPSGYLSPGSVISVFDQMSNFKMDNVTVIPAFGTINEQSEYIINNNGIRVDFIWDELYSDWKLDIGGDITKFIGGGIGGSNPISVTGNYNANVGDFIFVDTSTNTVIITLPDSDTLFEGDGISIYDTKSTFGTNNVTVNATNSTIIGDPIYIANISSSRIDFIYKADLNDWKIDIGGFGILPASRIPSLDANKITTGTVSIERLPHGALERLHVVADQTARLTLTTALVQTGDTVKQTDTGVMYYITDDTKLNLEDGYSIYTAGTATSVDWSGVTSKPTSFVPSIHTHQPTDVIQNTTNRFVTDTEKSTWNAKQDLLTSISNGYGTRTVSTSSPTGGIDGDVWYKY